MQDTLPMHSTMLRAALLTSAVPCARPMPTHKLTSLRLCTRISVPSSSRESRTSLLHSFFGSDAVTVDTTTSDELRAGCTNAGDPNDLSVYWGADASLTVGRLSGARPSHAIQRSLRTRSHTCRDPDPRELNDTSWGCYRHHTQDHA